MMKVPDAGEADWPATAMASATTRSVCMERRPETLGNRVLIPMNAKKRQEWVNESIAEANARTGAKEMPKGLLEVMDLVKEL